MSRKIEYREQTSITLATDPGVSRNTPQLDEWVSQLETYLSSRLDVVVHIRLSENYEEVLVGLERGEIDAAKLGPYAFALAQTRLDAHALVNLQEIKSGDVPLSPPYRSIIFTRADSGITHIGQLKGQSFGFVNAQSTTGYLVATFLLQQAGIDAAIDIRPVFLQSHIAVVEAVLQGKVAAGAVMEAEFMRHNSGGVSALRLLAASPLLSRGPIVVRQNLPAPLERKLLAALLQLHHDNPECAQLLKLPTQRFVPAVQRERTLKMIAELAGVSYATVSRAINGRDRISPQTTARILKLVEELGYRPNANARSLHKSRGDLVGLLLPSLHYPNLDAIVEGIQGTLNEAHMHLLVCPVGRHGQRQEAYFEMLSNSRFEGVLFTQWSAIDPNARELIRSGHPSVLLEQDLLHGGLITAWKWLHERGYQRVGLVVGMTSLFEPITTRRICAQLDGTNFQFIDFSAFARDVGDIFKDMEHMPTAFVCTDEQTTLEVRKILTQSETDALVLSIGDSPLTRWARIPALTFDGVTLGRMATQRLLKMMSIAVAPHDVNMKFWIDVP